MKIDSQELFKEIDLIQGCINRMAHNCFVIKGWALTLFAGVVAVSKAAVINDFWLLVCTVLVPFWVFWLLDAFFLQTERKYRKMYAWVLKERASGNSAYQYDLDPARFADQVGSLFCTMFSRTLTLFYCIPTLMIFALIIRLFVCKGQ